MTSEILEGIFSSYRIKVAFPFGQRLRLDNLLKMMLVRLHTEAATSFRKEIRIGRSKKQVENI
jgi:hypothetical protein